MSDTFHAPATPTAAAASPPTSERSLRAFRIFSYCIAALLLTTALLKIHMLVTNPLVDLRIGVHPSALWMAAILEICTVFNAFSALLVFSDRAPLFAFFGSCS